MPAQKQAPAAVPFQTLTRSANATANATANAPATPTPRKSYTRGRGRPVPPVMDQQLIAALQALTTQLDQGRAAAAGQQQALVNQNQNLIDLLNQHVNNNANPQPQIAQSLVETIPRFEGAKTDFPQDFVDCVNRVAAAEGWNDQQTIQVASRRLAKTAMEWHVHAGHNHATWNLWSAALLNNFNPRVPYGVWMAQVQERRQRPGESGIEYALDKRKLLRLAPVPLNDEQTVAFLISGLAKWQHEGAMSANRPANFDAFLTRIRDLEAMDVSTGPAYSGTTPVATAVAAYPPPIPINIPPPMPVPPLDLNQTLAAFGEKLIASMETRLGLAAGGRSHVASTGPPSAGRGRGGSPRTDSRVCYVCHRTGHIARFCPDRT